MEKEDFKKNSQNEFKNKWHEKRMYGRFVREMHEEIDKDLSCKWLVQSDLKVQTEGAICVAQEQALRTNYTKYKTDKTWENPLCRMCGERGETVQHIVCECKKLAQRSIREDMTQLQNWSTGNCARNITLKEKRSGTSIALKELWKMTMLN